MSNITSENIFELIGVYFANCYWNTLYTLSIDVWREEQFDKKDEAYKTIIERYSRAFCAPNDKNEKLNKHYVRIIKDIYLQYREFLGTGETLVGFIDVVSGFLLPKDYYKSLSSSDPKKDIILRKILTKTLMKFTIYISQQEVENVIDEKLRQDKKCITEWKKKFIDILTHERNEFCTLLLAQGSGIDIKNKDEIPQIPKEVCDKLQMQIKKLIIEKSELIHKINKYVKYINVLKKIVREKDSIIEKMVNASESEEDEKTPVTRSSQSRKKVSYRTSRTPIRFTRKVRSETPEPTESKTKPAESSANISQVFELKNKALEELENEEYSGEEITIDDKVVNVEEVELPGDEFKSDE